MNPTSLHPVAAKELIRRIIEKRNSQGGWPGDFEYYYLFEALSVCFSPHIVKSDLMSILKDMDSSGDLPEKVLKKHSAMIANAQKNAKDYKIVFPIFISSVFQIARW